MSENVNLDKRANNSDSAERDSLLQEDGIENLAELYIQFLPLVKSRAAFYAGDPSEYEDFVQEASIGFLDAVRSFDAGRSKFPAFAKICIDRKLIGCLRHASRKGSVPQSAFVNSDEFDNDYIKDASPDPAKLVIDEDKYLRLLECIEKSLSDFEYGVFRLYVSGFSYDEISHRMNVSRKSVDNAVQRARSKLKNIV